MHLTTQPQNTEANTNRNEGKNRQINNNIWTLQYPTFIMVRTTRHNQIRKEIHRRLQQYYKRTRPSRHLENTPTDNRIHVLLKSTRTILQDRPYVRA